MRFTLSSTALSSKLSALSKVINSKNALPILGDFVFEINDNILYLTASDSENVMKSQLELTESDGACRRLRDIRVQTAAAAAYVYRHYALTVFIDLAAWT